MACGVEVEQALAAAHEVGYPVLVRPSYVLGGQGMEIAYNDRNITEFMRIINQVEQEHPILVDKYLMGREVEVDGVFDGEELLIPGNILSGVNDAVARAYTDGRLRMSVVADALLDRTNTGDNTPAFAEIALRPGRGATLHVLLKGGGSDNASRVVMLAPGAGWEGVKKVVLDCVREKAANACPPLIVGVGVGVTRAGVQKGVERVTKVMMKALFVVLVAL